MSNKSVLKAIETSGRNPKLKSRLNNEQDLIKSGKLSNSFTGCFKEILFNGRESRKAVEIRYDDCDRNIKEVDYKINNFYFQMNEVLVNDLYNYIEDTYSDENDTHQFLKSRIFGLPTALVFGGYDPSRENLFESFARSLSEKQQTCVVLIDSTTVLKLEDLVTHTIRYFKYKNGSSFSGYNHFFAENTYNSDDEETIKDDEELEEDSIDEGQSNHDDESDDDMNLEEESGENDELTSLSVKDVVDIESLVKWYESNAKLHGLRSLPKLIIIIYNFDLLDPVIAEKYLHILNEHKSQIPIVLILGISSGYRGIDAIHEGYSYSVERLLRLKEFHLSDNIHNFDELIARFFIKNHFGVKVGIRPYNFLNDMYGRLKVSLKYFECSIKHVINYYFYSNPLSILTTIDPDEVSSRVDLLNKYHIEMIRMQPSFRRLVEHFIDEHSHPKVARSLLEDDNSVKSILPNILRDMKNYHQNFAVAFEIVHNLQQYVCDNPKLIKAKYELYSYALTHPGLGEHEHVRKLKFRDLKQFLENFQNVLEKAECVNSAIPKFFEKLEQIGNLLQSSIKLPKNKKRKKKTAILMQGEIDSIFALAPSSTTSQEITDKFTKLIDEIFEYLQVFFKKNLCHYSTKTLYEIFYWEESYSLEGLFLPRIRQSIATALGRPKQYLNYPAGKISYTQDDRCILYKLLVGFGKFIHINDWLESFENIIKKENRNITDDETKARFCRAFESLKIVGVIADAKGKRGYVRKMIWGKF
ncbi:12143_t:CDS:10 [Funneliformis caledonium]|uniref:Origin recognition complex subunit 3 n=1 Tax=Funneliformis caledonium TaxID=1117310 RepID=A0A9N8YSN4_9GLOM|nr:12143_t:CDS:10 [Funneliformis caledonium]